jgi:5-methylcytosine-specific restriction endonuclease McrA
VRLKLDPGSKTTGVTLVRESQAVDADTGEVQRSAHVLFLAELVHRGHAIRDALRQRAAFRRRRRCANLRYRAKRFNNRRRPEGWLAPSLRHRVETTLSWVERLCRWAPVTALSLELVRFDTQALQNPEISGIEYQQGELQGYEDAENVPLEIDHIHPRSKGGSDRVSNLTLACHPCNQRKGNLPVEQFLAKHPERIRKILAQAKAPLRDAAAVNSTRWALFDILPALKGKDSFPGCRVPYSLGYIILTDEGGCHNPNYWA